MARSPPQERAPRRWDSTSSGKWACFIRGCRYSAAVRSSPGSFSARSEHPPTPTIQCRSLLTTKLRQLRDQEAFIELAEVAGVDRAIGANEHGGRQRDRPVGSTDAEV